MNSAKIIYIILVLVLYAIWSVLIREKKNGIDVPVIATTSSDEKRSGTTSGRSSSSFTTSSSSSLLPANDDHDNENEDGNRIQQQQQQQHENLSPPSTSSSTSTTPPSSSNTPRLWITVDRWGEGMSGWTESLSEMLLLTKALNATFIEPCILHGRIIPCNSTTLHYLRLSDIFDETNLSKLYQPSSGSTTTTTTTDNNNPVLASYETFQQETTSVYNPKETPLQQYQFCLMSTFCVPPELFRQYCGSIVNRGHPTPTSIPELRQAYEAQQTTQQHVLVKIKFMCRHTMNRLQWPTSSTTTTTATTTSSSYPPSPVAIASGTLAVALKQKYFMRFHSQHYQRVDELLLQRQQKQQQQQQSGTFHNNDDNKNISISVIHWRAEIPKIDYIACAQAIIETRNHMIQQQQSQSQQGEENHEWILMSSVNANPEYMWGTARDKESTALSSPSRALEILQQEGFQKLDTLLSQEEQVRLRDTTTLLAIYDLILATKATQFATCTKGCEHVANCNKCNWLGQYGQTAAYMREKIGKTTFTCWP